MATSLRIACCLMTGAMASCVGCSRFVSEPSACDGLSEKTVGITREDYRDCAGEILATLDSLALPLGRFVADGDEGAGSEARAHAARLRHLMDEVGFQADVVREAREGPGRTVQRWPDSAMRQFNGDVFNAAVQYISALGYPNEGNLREGESRHVRARRAYAGFR